MKKLILALVFITLACSKGDGDNSCPTIPNITTNDINEINYDIQTNVVSAKLTAQINNIPLGPNCETYPVTNQGFVWNTNIQPTTQNNVSNANGTNASTTLTGLSFDTTYYVRAYLTNSLGTFYGNEVSFKTPSEGSPVYLDDNGITIKARSWATVGDEGNINGVIYRVVDLTMLNKIMYEYHNDNSSFNPNNCVTTYIDNMNNGCANREWGQDGCGNLNVDSSVIFFYREYDFEISSWDVSNVTTMSHLFINSSFNRDISSWDTSNVLRMDNMFENSLFNQDISEWNTSNLTNIESIFKGSLFNGDLNKWDVSKVTTMRSAFSESEYNNPLDSWDVSNVVYFSYMFHRNPKFNQDISNWKTSSAVRFNKMFAESVFNQDISNWDTSNVTNFSEMFTQNNAFNQPIGDWDTSKAEYMGGMFHITESFNQDISDWDVSNVVGMSSMFHSAEKFNQDLSKWDVSKMQNLSSCINFCYKTPSWSLPKPNFSHYMCNKCD